LKFTLIIFVLIFFPAILIPIHAQQTSDVIIFTHVILRDSQGNLVISFEPTKIGYLNIVALNNFLDDESTVNDPILDFGSQKMQIIEREGVLNFDSDNVLSDTTLNVSLDDGQILTLVRLIHDGITVTTDDELSIIWTFIRPV